VQRTGLTLVRTFNDCTVAVGAGKALRRTYFVPNGARFRAETGQVGLQRVASLQAPSFSYEVPDDNPPLKEL
jgi:hypothetical protein